MRAVTLLCVFLVKFLRLSRDASHVRRGGGPRCDRPTKGRDTRNPPAREICLSPKVSIPRQQARSISKIIPTNSLGFTHFLIRLVWRAKKARQPPAVFGRIPT